MSNIDENYYYQVINGTRQFGKSYVTNMIKERDRKIQELTNNWNELEEWLQNEYNEWSTVDDEIIRAEARQCIEVLDKMKEIKENNK